MTKEEYTELKRMVAEVHNGDVHLGRVLHAMLDHLASAHGLGENPARPAVPEGEAPPPRRSSRA